MRGVMQGMESIPILTTGQSYYVPNSIYGMTAREQMADRNENDNAQLGEERKTIGEQEEN